MPMIIDASELKAFAKALDSPARIAKTRAAVSAAVKKGAMNVKTAIQDDVRSSDNKALRRIQIGFEMQTVGTSGIAADISPREGGPSDLANIAFFGTARGGGTHKFYEHAEKELPTLEQYVAKAADL